MEEKKSHASKEKEPKGPSTHALKSPAPNKKGIDKSGDKKAVVPSPAPAKKSGPSNIKSVSSNPPKNNKVLGHTPMSDELKQEIKAEITQH